MLCEHPVVPRLVFGGEPEHGIRQHNGFEVEALHLRQGIEEIAFGQIGPWLPVLLPMKRPLAGALIARRHPLMTRLGSALPTPVGAKERDAYCRMLR